MESKHLELTKKSKKFKKTYNLFDFVVVKQKNKRTNLVTKVKVSKQILKRGKVRRKKFTTIKKRIVKERAAKRLNEISAKENHDQAIETVTEKIAQIQLENSSIESPKNETSEPTELELPALPTNSAQISTIQHSRNFREYCNQFITQEIKNSTEAVLKDLFKFQENKFQQNPGEDFVIIP